MDDAKVSERCRHENYHSVRDNAMILYICEDCGVNIGGSSVSSGTSEKGIQIDALEAEVAELKEQNIRLLQQIAHLNAELDEYFMDRQILTHMVDDTTEDDE